MSDEPTSIVVAWAQYDALLKEIARLQEVNRQLAEEKQSFQRTKRIIKELVNGD